MISGHLAPQCYSRGGAMGHRSIQQKKDPLTNEIAILNLEKGPLKFQVY